MTNTNEKIKVAIEIFKNNLPESRVKFRPAISEANTNEVDFFTEDGLYCTINIRSQKIKGI